MSHAQKKVKWCLKKAEKEVAERGIHRGLLKGEPNISEAREHIAKAEHFLKATIHLKKDFSDISASTLFYAMYHSLLAIGLKFGYESRNQECTFALMYALAEEGKIVLKEETLHKIANLQVDPTEKTSVQIRELYQYGVSTALPLTLYDSLFVTAQEVLEEAKEVVEG
jgi:uncharacterized protein (UPF0332 family)